MLLVNPQSAFTWDGPLDIHGVAMRGVPEKQGWSFSRAGWLAAQDDPTLDADAVGKAVRQQLRPLSKPTLAKARQEYADRVVPDFPRYFIVEPTNLCNRRCPFCPIIVMRRPADFKGHMAWPIFLKLMRECGVQDVVGLSLYQLGESMFWKGATEQGEPLNITHMIHAAKTVGKFKIVNISTNGDVPNLATLLNTDLDDLIVSIDGTTKAVYEENRPGVSPADTFERTETRVLDFLDAKSQSGCGRPFVRLQVINKENTRDQVLEFIRRWILVPGVDDVFVKNLDSMRPWLGSTVVSDEEDAVKAPSVESMPCQHIWAVGSMTVDGTLNACAHDGRTELTDGANILTHRFEDWWRGRFLTGLRGDHCGGNFRAPCAECRDRDSWLG